MRKFRRVVSDRCVNLHLKFISYLCNMALCKNEIRRHFVNLAIFLAIFFALIYAVKTNKSEPVYASIEKLFAETGLSPTDELDRAVFRDVVSNFYEKSKAEKILSDFDAYLTEVATKREYKTGNDVRNLDFAFAFQLTLKGLKFFGYFAVIGFLLFYLSESFGLLKLKLKALRKDKIHQELVLRLKTLKNRAAPRKKERKQILGLTLALLVKTAAYFVLFSPVYLVAYVFKFNYENVTFIAYVFLAAFTNGTLAASVNKFYRLLESEKSKGYVETAKIKGLKAGFGKNDGVTLARIFAPQKYFGEHILKIIYENAHRQFIASFKEIARFLITGMIIIELSLNMQNGIFYEMLQSLMNREFDVALFIFALVFTVIKLSETATEFVYCKINRRYEN